MCMACDVGYIAGLSHVHGLRCGVHRGLPHVHGARCGVHRGLSHTQIRDKARSSPAVGLLRALWTHFASAPFSAPVAGFRGGVTMPLTTKQLRPLRVRVRAVSGVWGMWR